MAASVLARHCVSAEEPYVDLICHFPLIRLHSERRIRTVSGGGGVEPGRGARSHTRHRARTRRRRGAIRALADLVRPSPRSGGSTPRGERLPGRVRPVGWPLVFVDSGARVRGAATCTTSPDAMAVLPAVPRRDEDRQQLGPVSPARRDRCEPRGVLRRIGCSLSPRVASHVRPRGVDRGVGLRVRSARVRVLDGVSVRDLPRRVGMGIPVGRARSGPPGRPGRGRGGTCSTRRTDRRADPGVGQSP